MKKSTIEIAKEMPIKEQLAKALDGTDFVYNLDETAKEFYENGWHKTLVGALSDAVISNALDEILLIIKKHLLKSLKDNANQEYWNVARPDELGLVTWDRTKYIPEQIAQLDMFWSIMAAMFGDWGTSARSGWIDGEMVPAAVAFIDILLDE